MPRARALLPGLAETSFAAVRRGLLSAFNDVDTGGFLLSAVTDHVPLKELADELLAGGSLSQACSAVGSAVRAEPAPRLAASSFPAGDTANTSAWLRPWPGAWVLFWVTLPLQPGWGQQPALFPVRQPSSPLSAGVRHGWPAGTTDRPLHEATG